jgi:hypothetical protein
MGSEKRAAVAQRSQALTEANRIRSARAELKRELASGRKSAADVIAEPPRSATTMPVLQVVLSQPWWGPARSHRLLQSAAVAEDTSLGTLTERQRRALLTKLTNRPARSGLRHRPVRPFSPRR